MENEYRKHLMRANERQEAFNNGARQAFEALGMIYDMSAEQRRILFNNESIWELAKRDPLVIFDILNNKEKIIAQHVDVGDVLAKNDNEYNQVVVTYIHEDGSFDIIHTDKMIRGKVATVKSLRDGEYHKVGKRVSHFDIYAK